MKSECKTVQNISYFIMLMNVDLRGKQNSVRVFEEKGKNRLNSRLKTRQNICYFFTICRSEG